MGRERNWTPEEDAYLEDKWGVISVGGIAKKLNRSENAVVVRSQHMGLGAFLDAGDYVTWNQLHIALGLELSSSGYKMTSWVKNRGFPLHSKRVKGSSFKVVYLEEFWEWAEQNQAFIDLSKMEPYALGVEPDWVAGKRRTDKERRHQYKTSPWTKAEDEHLIRLVRKQQYGYRELSRMIRRTEGAIQRRLSDLGIKDRPLKADNNQKWTDEEYRLLGDLIAEGSKYEQMADVLGKSSKAVRGRIFQMYLTENLDKVRKLMGDGVWGDGRPDRKIKQYLLMNPEEKKKTRELITRLAAILRNQYRMRFDESDFWQKDLCQNWDGYCTAGEADCDSCISFQRIRPQYCKRCGKEFLERKESTYCQSCREARKKQYQRKYMVLNDRKVKL